jgi:hypothetical protein
LNEGVLRSLAGSNPYGAGCLDVATYAQWPIWQANFFKINNAYLCVFFAVAQQTKSGIL